MANTKKQKKQHANQKKQPANAVAPSSSMGNEQDQREQSAAVVSGSQDSIMSTIIKGITGFTIDSAESIIPKNDKLDFPNDMSETCPVEPAAQNALSIQPGTKAKPVSEGESKAKDYSAASENALDSGWTQVDIYGKIKDTDTDTDTEPYNTIIKGIGKGKAKATSCSLAQDDLDAGWEHVEAENSLNDNTIFTIDADRQLCILWFFTTHSFSTMASLLNYSLAQPLPVRIHGQDAKDRFLVLAKPTKYARAFVYHEVKRLSVTKNVEYKPPVQTLDQVFAEAWAKMQEQISEERELGENSACYDDLIDVEYLQRLGKQRLWGVLERKALQGRAWGGLGAKVTRPEGVELGSDLDLYMQGVRAQETMRLGKKGLFAKAKGLLGY
ncbi:hypothetical protein E2P81_ATG07897 [Venturia nashicola]|uniref:Uncharacterized protein n=1 Tax=Venturia nashicola TaxID=86259 RepID=A0A4Z1P7W1_9PEZI|nr:hypothetical protein E6O75_ATG08067 [Venturia nashicola]TLD26085.1 hypothetical protein E2P81_ATG07897 [Venturia nashicola]